MFSDKKKLALGLFNPKCAPIDILFPIQEMLKLTFKTDKQSE